MAKYDWEDLPADELPKPHEGMPPEEKGALLRAYVRADRHLVWRVPGQRDWDGADFSDVAANSIVFDNFNIDMGQLKGARLKGASFVEARMMATELLGADLSNGCFAGAKMYVCELTEVIACDANFTGANLDLAMMDEADFSRSRFISTVLDNAHLSESKFVECDFTNSQMNGTEVNSAILTHAKLTYVHAVEAHFYECNLQYAVLAKAKFDGTDFGCADLSFAVVEGADFSLCNFEGANLTGLVGTPKSARGARIDDDTYIRSGWTLKELQQWLDFGVILVHQKLFPTEVQAYLRSEKEGLTLYFSRPLNRSDRFMIDGVIVNVLGKMTDCEVVDFSRQGTDSLLRLQASNQNDLLTVAKVLHEELWRSPTDSPDRQALVELRTLHTSLITQLNTLTATLQRDRTELWQRQADGQVTRQDLAALMDRLTLAIEQGKTIITVTDSQVGAIGTQATGTVEDNT